MRSYEIHANDVDRLYLLMMLKTLKLVAGREDRDWILYRWVPLGIAGTHTLR